MKKHILFSIFTLFGVFIATACLQAQTYHYVNVSNFEFNPSQLSINVGDTVEWSNSAGEHNVNGTTLTFPENPEGFGNGTGPAGWTYSYVFSMEGNYSYRCDNHPDVMFGSIIVSGTPVSALEVEKPQNFEFYPNPATNDLHWKWNSNSAPANAHIQIYDVTGKLCESFQLGFESHKDVSKWTEGMYIYTIIAENEPIQTGKLFILK